MQKVDRSKVEVAYLMNEDISRAWTSLRYTYRANGKTFQIREATERRHVANVLRMLWMMFFFSQDGH